MHAVTVEFGKGKPELHSNFKPLGTRVKTKIKRPGYNRMWRLPQAFGVINLQIEIKSLLVFFFSNFIQSLVQTLKNRGKLTEPEVRYLMFQAVQACSYLHAQRVIHRDIKVGNFFLNADMELRLGDFGLAVRLKEEEKKIK